MFRKGQYFLLWLILLGIGSSFTPPQKTQHIANFGLLNVDGKMVKLNDYAYAKGLIVIFTCNHCPFAKLYPQRLNKLSETYAKKGVPLIAISSTDTITYEEDTYVLMQENAKKEAFNFPYLYDGKQGVARMFGAEKTPHAFVLWKVNGQWKIKYSGAIDDNGAEENQVQQAYVANAVDALLTGKPVPVTSTKSIGCQINFRK